MKKIAKKFVIFAIMVVSVMLICSASIYAYTEEPSYVFGEIVEEKLTPSKQYQYDYLDYTIDKYDVNIVVNENNTFDVTEVITAYFRVPKHGIFRTIPLRNTVTRLDGTSSTNRAQVSNLRVDNEYTTSNELGSLKVKIGSANKTITGEKTYVIKYNYNIGKDPVKNYDELYYNIIGTEWTPQLEILLLRLPCLKNLIQVY